jgi:hypothetical protein
MNAGMGKQEGDGQNIVRAGVGVDDDAGRLGSSEGSEQGQEKKRAEQHPEIEE